MEKEIELLFKRMKKALEMNDDEAIEKINEEVDKIIPKMLSDEDELAI